MDTQGSGVKGGREPAAAYEPPRVELVVTAADLEREVLYAGVSA